MSITTVQEAIRGALSNDPIGYATGHIDPKEADDIVYSAERSVKTGNKTPLTKGEIFQITDLFERRSALPKDGQLMTCAMPEIPGYTMDDGAVDRCESFFKEHNVPCGQNEEPMRQMMLKVVDETDLGAPLETPPNIKYLQEVSLRDGRPACGTLDVAWVDSEKGVFFLSMVSDQMPPPHVPVWFGPLDMQEVVEPEPSPVTPETRQKLLDTFNQKANELTWSYEMPVGALMVEVPLFTEPGFDTYSYTALIPVGPLVPGAETKDPNTVSQFLVARSGGLTGMTQYSNLIDMLEGIPPPPPFPTHEELTEIYRNIVANARELNTLKPMSGPPVADYFTQPRYDLTPSLLMDYSEAVYLIDGHLYLQETGMEGPMGPWTNWYDVGPAPMFYA